MNWPSNQATYHASQEVRNMPLLLRHRLQPGKDYVTVQIIVDRYPPSKVKKFLEGPDALLYGEMCLAAGSRLQEPSRRRGSLELGLDCPDGEGYLGLKQEGGVGRFLSLEIKKQRSAALFPLRTAAVNPSSVSQGGRGMTSLPPGYFSRYHAPLAEAELTSRERVVSRGRRWKISARFLKFSGSGSGVQHVSRVQSEP